MAAISITISYHCSSDSSSSGKYFSTKRESSTFMRTKQSDQELPRIQRRKSDKGETRKQIENTHFSCSLSFILEIFLKNKNKNFPEISRVALKVIAKMATDRSAKARETRKQLLTCLSFLNMTTLMMTRLLLMMANTMMLINVMLFRMSSGVSKKIFFKLRLLTTVLIEG